ncbi:MAG: type VI secretion system-associated protein TagO [Myxococcota bacterium]
MSLFSLATWLIVSSAIANETEIAITKCASLDDDSKRLQCFDKLAASMTPVNTPRESSSANDTPIISTPGDWQVTSKVNPLDDTVTDVVMLASENSTSRFGVPITLVIRCLSGKTTLYINWNDYLGSEAHVTIRVGDAKARRSEWSISTDHKSTFAPRPMALLGEMWTADRFVAQVTPYNESPVTAEFNIGGLSDAVTALSANCRW